MTEFTEPTIPPINEIELAARRDLAIKATYAISEVVGFDVTIPTLAEAAESPDPSMARVIARRALRCITEIASDDSRVLKAVGEDGIYHYAECVIDFGADTSKYLQLHDEEHLTASEVTGLYALREMVADNTNGDRPSFANIKEALSRVGMTVQLGAADPDEAASAFDAAGFFTDHSDRRQFARTIFFPPLGETPQRLVIDDPDGSITRGIIDGFSAEDRRFPEETED